MRLHRVRSRTGPEGNHSISTRLQGRCRHSAWTTRRRSGPRWSGSSDEERLQGTSRLSHSPARGRRAAKADGERFDPSEDVALEAPGQPDEGRLEQVVGLLPALDLGVRAEPLLNLRPTAGA